MRRREFVQTAAGAAGIVTAGRATDAVAAQEEGGGGSTAPDFGSWFSNVGNYSGPGSTVDATGQDSATVEVGVQANGGAYGFGPAAIHVDNGATVQFEWTGNGGGHNVLSDGDGPLDSGSPVGESGVNYEHTFENDGIYKYYCQPHEGLGMKGAVVVGSEYPTQTVGGGGVETIEPQEAGVPIRPHYVGFAAGMAILLPLVFTFFTLKYGESPHTSGGND